MNKTEAWAALFCKEPNAGVDFEDVLLAIAGDTEPDADIDEALDDSTRDREQSFLSDPNAFIQANSSDPRMPHWKRLVPTAAAAQQKPAKTKSVAATTPNPAPAAVPAAVTLPARKTGVSPNALAAAARAAAAVPVRPTLPRLGNAPAPTPSPAPAPAQAQPQPAPAQAQPQPAQSTPPAAAPAQPQPAQSTPPAAALAAATMSVPVTMNVNVKVSTPPTPPTPPAAAPAQPQPAQSTPPAAAPAQAQPQPAPVTTPVPTAGSSWGLTVGFIAFSCVCFIICVLTFKWVILDTLKYADMSANDGLHREHPSASEPEESPP